MRSLLKTPAEIATMREGGRILGAVLEYLSSQMHAGMTTEELDQLAVAEAQRLGGTPAFLGHEGFPKSLCVSVNDEVVHGIPGTRTLQEGDIVGLDFGIRLGGLITDGAVTVPVGQVNDAARRLLRVTKEALYQGIDCARDGNRVGDVSAEIERHLRMANLGIIQELAGHGVGHELWEEPQVPNYGMTGTGPMLKAGMTIAIEPMATLGSPKVRLLDDNWTVATRDGSLAAQFEHTVCITRGAPEILTQA